MKIPLVVSFLFLVGAPLAVAQTLVETTLTLKLGVPSKVEPSNPTQAQIDALMTRMGGWYMEHLALEFPALESFEAVYLCHAFDTNANFPVTIEIKGKSFFPDGQAAATKRELTTSMVSSLDFQDFLMNAVRANTPTGGFFHQVTRANVMSRHAQAPIVCSSNHNGNTSSNNIGDSSSSSNEPVAASENPGEDAPVSVQTTVTLKLGASPKVELSDPTPAQIDALMTRISEWYTGHLTQQFPMLESFTAVYICHTFDAQMDFPITIEIMGNSLFTNGQDPATKRELTFAMISYLDMQGFIRNTVQTNDQTGGTFDEVSRANMASRHVQTPPACSNNINAPVLGLEIPGRDDTLNKTYPQPPYIIDGDVDMGSSQCERDLSMELLCHHHDCKVGVEDAGCFDYILFAYRGGACRTITVSKSATDNPSGVGICEDHNRGPPSVDEDPDLNITAEDLLNVGEHTQDDKSVFAVIFDVMDESKTTSGWTHVGGLIEIASESGWSADLNITFYENEQGGYSNMVQTLIYHASCMRIDEIVLPNEIGPSPSALEGSNDQPVQFLLSSRTLDDVAFELKVSSLSDKEWQVEQATAGVSFTPNAWGMLFFDLTGSLPKTTDAATEAVFDFAFAPKSGGIQDMSVIVTANAVSEDGMDCFIVGKYSIEVEEYQNTPTSTTPSLKMGAIQSVRRNNDP